MNYKRNLVVLLVLGFVFSLAVASGNNELGYLQIGSLSDDPFVSMKTLSYKDIYEEDFWDRIELQYQQELRNRVYLQFYDEANRIDTMEPEIWETDEMFHERFDQEEQRLWEAVYSEMDRIALELFGPAEELEKLLEEYASKAMANLVRSQTLESRAVTVKNDSYDRNERTWSVLISSADPSVPFTDIPLAIDFTTIGDEKTIKSEIIAFERAVKDSSLEASVGWHFSRDYSSKSRFLLVMDFLSITNPLTGNSYAVTLEKPILIRTYTVTGQTVETLSVQESSYVSKVGVANLVYRDEDGQLFYLSGPKEPVTLAWRVEKQGAEPKSIQRSEPATSAVAQGHEDSQKKSAKAQPEAAKGPMIPNLPLTRLDGTKTTLNEVRDGKPAVINYFASWCPPCKQELPHFQKAFDEYGDEISFIFLDALDGQRETLKTINAFIKNFPFTGPVFYDSGEFAQTFQTTSLPTTVFMDKEGRLVTGYLGFVPEDVLYADLADVLM